VFSFIGHAHGGDVDRHPGDLRAGVPSGKLITAAVADFPHQFRLLELWDADNGFLMLRASAVIRTRPATAAARRTRA